MWPCYLRTLRAMSSRISHRFALGTAPDVLHAGVVVLSVCALSAGLVYVGYLAHVWRVARRDRVPGLQPPWRCVRSRVGQQRSPSMKNFAMTGVAGFVAPRHLQAI